MSLSIIQFLLIHVFVVIEVIIVLLVAIVVFVMVFINTASCFDILSTMAKFAVNIT